MRKKQYKEILYLIILSAIVGVIPQYFLENFDISGNVLSNIVIFLSIIFGFYITSFTIFGTSSYVSKLYEIEDDENPTKTLMHTLIFKYKTGLLITLFSILYFIIIIFITDQKSVNAIVQRIYLYPTPSIFILNFLYTYTMLSILIKIITQESKKKRDGN